MNKILISSIICFSFSVIAQACTQFLNKAEATLIIPLGQTCLLEDSSINNLVLNRIIIEGTLSIQDNLSLKIKYKDLTLGQKGSLEIGKDATIINNLIIFEDVSTSQCQEPTNTQSVGKINIQSRYIETYSLGDIYKSQNLIKMQSKPVNILTKQNYILVDSLSSAESNQLINIQEVQEQNLILKESILKDNLVVKINDDQTINPILFSDVPTLSGVIFKNTCLVGNIDKFQGVTLINPRGLYLKGGLIQSSLIKVESQDQKVSRIIKSEGGFQKNIFFKCSQLNLQIGSSDENSFIDNSLVNSDNIQINVKSVYFSNNQFIKSKVVINSLDQKNINLNQFKSYNSELSINSQTDSTIRFNKGLIYRNKIFTVSNDMKHFQLDQTIFFATPIDLSKAIVSTKFYISYCLFDGNNEVDHLAIFNSNSKQQNINIENSVAVKYNSFLFTTSDKLKQPQVKYFSRLTSENLFTIYLSSFKVNIKVKDYLPLFNLPMMSIVKDGSEEYNIVQIDDVNINNENIMLSQIKWAPVQTYQTRSLPTYFQLKDIITTDSNSNIKAQISFNNQPKQELNLNQFTQLIGQQSKNIDFTDSNGQILDPSELTIEFNAQKGSQSDIYQNALIFTSTKRAIKKITVVQLKDSKEQQVKIITKLDGYYSYSSNIVTSLWSQSLNQFSFTWKKMAIGFSVYKVKFEYCEENELFDGNKCVAQCNTSKSGFFCSDECSEGYYKDSNNPSTCLKCPFGCKQCIDSNTCTKCHEFYLQDGQKCIDNCGINSFQKNNQCQKCTEGCGLCSSNDYCIVCQDYYSMDDDDGKCEKCKENQDENCDNCPQNCKQCVYNSKYSCLECEDGYELVFGQCKKINTQDSSKICENGQSFIDGSCQQCFQGCLTCSSPNNSNRCDSCISSYKLDYFGYSCKKCRGGEYSVQRDVCQQCNQLCDKEFSCYGPSAFQCQKCQAGYFKDLQTNKCLACDLSQCKECSESPTQCTDCPEDKVLYEKKCLDKCPSGWYPDEKRVCRQCNQDLCQECSNSPTQCTECKKDQVLFEEKCYKDCKPGYFADIQNVCRKCDMNKCEECIQYDTKCTKCKGNLYLVNHSCEDSCPDKGYYFDKNNKCLPCHEDCEKCSGSPTNCTDCEYPMYLENNKCLQECPEGKYGAYVQSISMCLQCDKQKCQTCIDNKSKCTSCHDGYFLHKNQCLSDCPKGTIKNLVTQNCLVCLQPNCAVCGDNVGVCIQCREGFIQHQGICIVDCPFGYFLNKSEKKCQECDKRVCMECSESPTVCTKCYPEHYNVGNGVCSTSCPKMSYPFQQGDQQVCMPCDPKCTKGCVGPLDSECLEAVYITQEANNQAILIGLLVVCFILLIGLVIVAYMYYRKKQQAMPIKSYLLKRESQSDIGTIIQMEKTESLKRV
ncbi:transmembrane protein, putative (macronuclear) [Tetrahymena thermophila SB210]|uniref:Transmembrane protein, putative n=1 Tax=Tetrahymena thermophila (strain SB210) TaxID=312017 RepID=Q235Z7_TETTS|nr:transmembrane protein, putative [Tetrahymena thermophila SB210]EAR92603.2 transmembrane protein, putative [Tetrahymena thermophila SB210]|eukprot:XP_001012848.2 transmembrane protein, putative [Tetrahymena thermophila SB210]